MVRIISTTCASPEGGAVDAPCVNPSDCGPLSMCIELNSVRVCRAICLDDPDCDTGEICQLLDMPALDVDGQPLGFCRLPPGST